MNKISEKTKKIIIIINKRNKTKQTIFKWSLIKLFWEGGFQLFKIILYYRYFLSKILSFVRQIHQKIKSIIYYTKMSIVEFFFFKKHYLKCKQK